MEWCYGNWPSSLLLVPVFSVLLKLCTKQIISFCSCFFLWWRKKELLVVSIINNSGNLGTVEATWYVCSKDHNTHVALIKIGLHRAGWSSLAPIFKFDSFLFFCAFISLIQWLYYDCEAANYYRIVMLLVQAWKLDCRLLMFSQGWSLLWILKTWLHVKAGCRAR